MSSLYELTNNVMYLQGLLEDGEIDEQTYLDSVESMCIGDKIENVCKMVKNLQYKADAYKAEIERMTIRKRTIENSVQRLKDSMLNHMMVADNKKIQAGVFTVSVGRSKSVEVVDETAIPNEYLIPQKPKIDKVAIKAALKDGEVDGAVLVENPFLTIR